MKTPVRDWVTGGGAVKVDKGAGATKVVKQFTVVGGMCPKCEGTGAVKDIDLDIPEKRVTALIGPSGCGKSTLLRVFNRIYAEYPGLRASGQVRLDGIDILDAGYPLHRLRSQVGMVFQRPNPFPTMSIKENVLAGVRLNSRRISAKAADELAERALRGANLWNEVKDRLNAPGTGLSGGQQQRLAIGRALAPRPALILADEPTGNLDETTAEGVLALLLELVADSESSLLMVTHSPKVAAPLTKQVVLHRGQLLAPSAALPQSD